MSWRDWVRGAEIEPSIYAADFTRLGEQLIQTMGAGARIFHYDIGDGHFVEPVTIGPIVIESIAELVHGHSAVLDCHLMVSNPERHIPQVAKAGGDSVTFHFEATDDPVRTAAQARALDLGVGLAFKPESAVETAVEAAVAAGVDLVLCMSIEPGYSGQEFLPEAYERLRRVRELLPAEVYVQVDGGVKAENAGHVRGAGAELLVAGSAVFGAGDPAAAYTQLAHAVA
jgi:ribulose-phosphate 3-epimerase